MPTTMNTSELVRSTPEPVPGTICLEPFGSRGFRPFYVLEHSRTPGKVRGMPICAGGIPGAAAWKTTPAERLITTDPAGVLRRLGVCSPQDAIQECLGVVRRVQDAKAQRQQWADDHADAGMLVWVGRSVGDYVRRDSAARCDVAVITDVDRTRAGRVRRLRVLALHPPRCKTVHYDDSFREQIHPWRWLGTGYLETWTAQHLGYRHRGCAVLPAGLLFSTTPSECVDVLAAYHSQHRHAADHAPDQDEQRGLELQLRCMVAMATRHDRQLLVPAQQDESWTL
jgi:hypothetical protein